MNEQNSGRIIDVIIPAHNEEKSIPKVLGEISKELVRQVIVVCNCCTDNTFSEAEKHGAVALEENRKGYGWACLKGMDYMKDAPPDIVVFLDGDYSDYPEEIEMLVEPILKGEAKMVIGSRVLGEREKGSLTPQQVFGNWLATRLIRLFYGARFTDLGPFRAIDYEALKALKMSDKTYGWTIEMQIKLVKKKWPFAERAVRYRKRIGVSKVSGTVKGTVLAGIKIIFAVFKYRF
ncbi:MAG: glycosyltransferase family 2 protein [Bacteroidetes bacterium]|nr:MAG: glycosyltransferase family 2 protein [Bacteroidota bacterium]